jgi:hypothetical protein
VPVCTGFGSQRRPTSSSSPMRLAS